MPGDILGEALHMANLIADAEGLDVVPPSNIAPGDRVTINSEEYTVTSVTHHPTYVPGGGAIRYKPTTTLRVRMPSPVLGVPPQPAPGPNPCGETFLQGNDVFGACLAHTKIDWAAIVEAFEETRPKKSVWEWIRNPAL